MNSTFLFDAGPYPAWDFLYIKGCFFCAKNDLSIYRLIAIFID